MDVDSHRTRPELGGAKKGGPVASSEPPVLLHVGFVKTGSTWLQRHLTNNRARGFAEIADRQAIRRLLIEPYDLWYDPAPFRRHILTRVDEARRRGLTPVLTHERLAGNPICGGVDSNSLALRLAEQFERARVLIIIREQRSHLLSIYNEYVAGGGACSLESFLHPPAGAKLPLFNFRFLEFHRLILRYQELFGRGHVCVLPFEALRRNPREFCRQIHDFAETTYLGPVPQDAVRRSMSPMAVQIRRRLNFLFYRDNSNPSAPWRVPAIARLSRLMAKAVPLRLEGKIRERQERWIREYVGDRYVDSNRKTEQATGLALRQYGYV